MKINIQRQKITTKSCRLSDKWTIEATQDVFHEISDALLQEITKIIDNEILAEQLLAQGWHGVPITTDALQYTITQWCLDNCQDQYRVCHHMCLFKRAEDAMQFQLTWG